MKLSWNSLSDILLLTGPCGFWALRSSFQWRFCSGQREVWQESANSPRKNKANKAQQMRWDIIFGNVLYVVYLQRTINLTSVKHKVKVVQVVNCRFPGNVVSLLCQVLCGLKRSHRFDDLWPLVKAQQQHMEYYWTSWSTINCIISVQYLARLKASSINWALLMIGIAFLIK